MGPSNILVYRTYYHAEHFSARIAGSSGSAWGPQLRLLDPGSGRAERLLVC